MKYYLGLWFALLWIGEAFALSCLPPTPESLFSQHQNSPAHYVMAAGTVRLIDPLPRFNPKTLLHEPDGRIRAIFEGRLAGASGFDRRARIPILVERKCFNEVCGALPLHYPAALFLEKESDGYVLHIDYCNSTLLPHPTASDLTRLIHCLNNGQCSDAALPR